MPSPAETMQARGLVADARGAVHMSIAIITKQFEEETELEQEIEIVRQEADAKIAELQAKRDRLHEQRETWESMSKPLTDAYKMLDDAMEKLRSKAPTSPQRPTNGQRSVPAGR